MISLLISRMIAALAKPKLKTKPAPAHHVAICVGHSRIGDTGARSVGGVNEWVYNKAVAQELQSELEHHGIKSTIISHYPRKTYLGAMTWLRIQLDHIGATLAIELHFNAADNPDAQGFEYLHAGSPRGMHLASCLAHAHSQSIPFQQRNRGIKAVARAERGGGFLHRVKPTAVIAEPFFGTNPDEWNFYRSNAPTLAKAYAAAIRRFIDPGS